DVERAALFEVTGRRIRRRRDAANTEHDRHVDVQIALRPRDLGGGLRREEIARVERGVEGAVLARTHAEARDFLVRRKWARERGRMHFGRLYSGGMQFARLCEALEA